MATIIAGIAKFERELIWSASAQALQPQRRVAIARAPARRQRLKSDRLAPKVLALVAAGQSFRLIGRELGLSKNTGRGNR
jgi:DNA invertase Pin-like site-specific DNA recombinase